ncbi:MAG: SMP-30/gluconolactonase/LRE family protein, partial [Novosphingobium sp.]|nr:SMP-30/gluconolactonase/LRE family protein [Novosphingobium sp.]
KGGLFLGTVDHLSMLSGKEFYGKSALWRLSPDGSADLFQDGIGFANGIGLSPAGECVYVVDSAAGVIAIELRADGRPGKTAMHCALAGIDGITVDAAGNIWAALIMSGEVARIAPDGRVSERIAVPGGHPVAVCFGGPALADLYVTTAAPGAGEAALDRSLVPDVARSAGIYRLANAGHGLPLARSGFSLA